MKKVLAFVMMSMLLLPVMALAAASIPERIDVEKLMDQRDIDRLSVEVSWGPSWLVLHGSDQYGAYDAYYTFGGELSHYRYNFSDGCTKQYSRDGKLYMNDDYRREAGAADRRDLAWTDGKWMIVDDEAERYFDVDLGDSWLKDHNPEKDHAAAMVAYDESVSRLPPKLITDAYDLGLSCEEIRAYALNAFPMKEEDFKQDNQDGMIRANKDGWVALAKKDNAYGWVFGVYRQSKLQDVYIGTLGYRIQDDQFVMAGDGRYGVFNTANYDGETGELKEFVITTPDESQEAQYSARNVLLFYVAWISPTAIWRYDDGIWEYIPGLYGEADWERGTPPESVVQNILRIPGRVIYMSECATDAKDVADTTVPFLVAPEGAIGSASVEVRATTDENLEREVTYDVSLSENGVKVQPNQPVSLYLPYPNGMTMSTAKDYDFVVVHEKDNSTTEIMSTMTDTARLTEQGIEVKTDSFSPFTVDWGQATVLKAKYPDAIVAPGSLPQTGDTSSLLLPAGVLAISVCALALLLRKRGANS